MSAEQKHDEPPKRSKAQYLNGQYLTSQGFVDLINEGWGIGLTRSRLAKDRMKQKDGSPGIAPEPVAWFGNRALFKPCQAPSYVAKLITPARLEPDPDESAQRTGHVADHEALLHVQRKG